MLCTTIAFGRRFASQHIVVKTEIEKQKKKKKNECVHKQIEKSASIRVTIVSK